MILTNLYILFPLELYENYIKSTEIVYNSCAHMLLAFHLEEINIFSIIIFNFIRMSILYL